MSDLGAVLRASGVPVRERVPLAEFSTYRVGGPARWFVEPDSEEELVALARVLAARPEEVLVVGRGSNLLVHDDGFDGVAVHLGPAFAEIAVEATLVVAGGAAGLPVVARRSVAAGLTGFEWAVGVPGSVGGAVRMNAGGHGSDMAAVLQGVHVVDLGTGETQRMTPAALRLGYRRSSIGSRQVVVSAEIALREGDAARGEAEMAEIVAWRREHQPGGHNAGSVFTNPPGDSAGRLVDEAGCKGLRVGTAQVSAKHANFIQADDGGSAADVYRLMVEVASAVRRRSGIDLHPETRLVGFPELPEELG
jgi:UDP-N-acetylmuramate dehydrogenase